jgi:23S rRNA pseudouridine1911/1915/1917 synthase
VRVGGQPATDAARRIQPGEVVELTAEAGPEGLPRRLEQRVVHLDRDVAVAEKPAGILTVPFARADRDTLLSRVRSEILRREARSSPGQAARPTLRAVQRLDKEASGLVVFARSVAAQRHLQLQFAGHTVLRRYLALVRGRAAAAVHDTWLVPDRGDGLAGSWRGRGEAPAGARRAITRVRLRETLPGATLVECEIPTGRRHQIRIHLAEAGNPVLGDPVYGRGAGESGRPPRLMLHAAELGFVHPRSAAEMRFTSDLPADFAAFVERLRGGGAFFAGS